MHSKNRGLGLFCTFWGQNMISKNLPLSYTAPHGLLTPFWVPEKAKEPIPRKHLNRETLFILSGHGQESYKRIRQLSGIAVDNKNKIQYNSA